MLQRARWLTLIIAAVAVTAGPANSQSGVRLDDSLFLPIQLPPTLSFGYPPNDTHIPAILEMIRKRDFDALDRKFGELQVDVARDVRHETRFSDAFEAVERDDPDILAGLSEWIAARPRSAHARVARAHYHFATAWRRRGKRYIRDTPQENLRGMMQFAKLAQDDLLGALALDETHLEAYAQAIALMQLAGSHRGALALMAKGSEHHPGSYTLARSFILSLWPRWGGAESLMEMVANAAVEDSAINPRLVTLRGAVFENRANDSSLADNYAGAVRELNKALGFGPERTYLAARGEAYFRLGAYEYAFLDLRKAMMERSQDARVLDLYGRTLVELAARCGGSPPSSHRGRRTSAAAWAASCPRSWPPAPRPG
jgi:tetratricopeptide (TPR) repeat protein